MFFLPGTTYHSVLRPARFDSTLPTMIVNHPRYTDYVMPFMIQYLRNLHEKVEAVDARTKVCTLVFCCIYRRNI